MSDGVKNVTEGRTDKGILGVGFDHSLKGLFHIILNDDLTVVMVGKGLIERFIEVGDGGGRHQGSQ